KPEGERRSQVVVNGRPDAELSRTPWRDRAGALWPPIESALQTLLAEYELVLIEGAGSPAETNLRDTDLAHMRVALTALEQVARVEWVTVPHELDGADLVVLPGSKHVAADLAWLRRTGLADAVAAHARSGRRVLGICGGLQMLGERLEDEAGVDGSAEGL